MTRLSAGRQSALGFSLLELLVAMAVTLVLAILVFETVSSVSAAWRRGSGQAGAFHAARAAMEGLSRQLSQATLATYLAYADAQGNPVPLVNPSFRGPSAALARDRVPTQYLRASELHFVSGPATGLLEQAGVSGLVTPGHAVFFQAPLGHVRETGNRPKTSLLNAVGFFVEHSSDAAWMPPPLQGRAKPRFRYRLMQVLQPAEDTWIYQSTVRTDPASGLPLFEYDLEWVRAMRPGQMGAHKSPLAENILLLVLLPRFSALEDPSPEALAPLFIYDSRSWEDGSPFAADRRWRNQLPPVMEIICVAIDEPSAQRLADRFGIGGAPPHEHPEFRAALDFNTVFQEAARLEDDVRRVREGLERLGVGFRILRTQVVMRGAKWTS